MNLSCSGGDVIQQAVTRPGDEGRCQVVQLVMALEQVVAQTQVQGQAACHFPVILEIGAKFDIAPVSNVARQLSRLTRDESGIHAGHLEVGSVCSEPDAVSELVRWSSDVELAVLDVSLNVSTNLDVVRTMADGNHVAVTVFMFLKQLRIAVIGTKT